MRDLVQFGGWRGGGATSWDHRERERSVVKIEELEMGSTGGRVEVFDLGKRVSRCPVVDVMRSDIESKASKLRRGGCVVISLQVLTLQRTLLRLLTKDGIEGCSEGIVLLS